MIDWFKGADVAARTIASLFVTAIVLCFVLAVLTMCTARQDAAQSVRRSEAAQTMADARTAASGDASAIRDRADARSDQITNAIQEGTDDVRQAPDRTAANRAARLGVCRVNPNAGPDCRVLLADSRRVD